MVSGASKMIGTQHGATESSDLFEGLAPKEAVWCTLAAFNMRRVEYRKRTTPRPVGNSPGEEASEEAVKDPDDGLHMTNFRRVENPREAQCSVK